jgi:hypothetical protein
MYMLCTSCKFVQIIICMKLENTNYNLYKISLRFTYNLYNFLSICNVQNEGILNMNTN